MVKKTKTGLQDNTWAYLCIRPDPFGRPIITSRSVLHTIDEKLLHEVYIDDRLFVVQL